MKTLQIINTLATLLLLVVVLVFGIYFIGHMPKSQDRVADPPMAVGVDAPPSPLPKGTRRLVVIRGLKVGVEYPLYQGPNFIGRADVKPVDIDLEEQEQPDRIWSSFQHALITLDNGDMVIEDLNSVNGTFVNRNRIPPGQKKSLKENDLIQVGSVQMKVR